LIEGAGNFVLGMTGIKRTPHKERFIVFDRCSIVRVRKEVLVVFCGDNPEWKEKKLVDKEAQ